MFKRGISIFEYALFVVISTAFQLIMTVILDNNTLVFIIQILNAMLVINVVAQAFIVQISKSRLPNASMYNIFGYVEIHIQKKCHGDIFLFPKLCSEVILYAVEKRKKIMFDTNIVYEKHLRRLFEGAIDIYKPSILQKYINVFFAWCYKVKTDDPYVRAIINADKLTSKQIETIKSLYNRSSKYKGIAYVNKG